MSDTLISSYRHNAIPSKRENIVDISKYILNSDCDDENEQCHTLEESSSENSSEE